MPTSRTHLVAATVALAVLIGISGCANAPTVESDPKPSPVVAPSEEPEATEDPLQVRSDELAAMGWEEYKAVSRSDMLLHTDNLLKRSYPESEQFRSDDDQTLLSEFNPRNIASPTNTGDEILQQYWFMNQLAMAQVEMNGIQRTDVFDPDSARKALTGAYYYSGDEPFVMSEYNGMMRWIDESTNAAELSSRFTFVSESPVTESTDRYGDPISFKDITYMTTTTGDQKNLGRFAYVKYTDANGDTKGRWMPMVSTKAETPEILDLQD